MPARSLEIAASRSAFSLHQRVVLGLDLAGVLLGPQVDRAERVALALEAVHVVFDLLGRGHRVEVVVEVFEQALRAWSRDPPRSARRRSPRSRARRRPAPRPGRAPRAPRRRWRSASRSSVIASRSVASAAGQRIERLGAARLGLGDRAGQFVALGGELGRGGRWPRFSSASLSLLALGQFGDALAGAVEPVPPAGDLLGDLLRPRRPRLALALQLVMRRARGQHRHSARPRPCASRPRPRRGRRRDRPGSAAAASASVSRVRAASASSSWRVTASQRLSSLPAAMLRSASARDSARLRLRPSPGRHRAGRRARRLSASVACVSAARRVSWAPRLPVGRAASAPSRSASARRAGSAVRAAARRSRAHPRRRRATRPSATDRRRG